MAEDKGTVDTVEPDAPDTEAPDTTTPDTDAPEDTPDTVSRAELVKAVARRDKALTELRKLKAEQAKAAEPADTTPDPVEVANGRLVRAEARTHLATLGITDKADVSAILDVLRLDGVDVDDSGEVDADEVSDRIERVRKAFTSGQPAKPRTPRVDTRTKTDSGPSDPDAERYRRIREGR